MAFELIPFPLSALFVLVAGLVFVAILWKLRKTGRIYSIIFKASAILGIIMIVLFLYEIVANML
jgi:hypothetical protein